MKKRVFTGLIAAVFCGIFLLAACSGSENAEMDANAEMTLSLYCMENNYSVDQYILEFEKAYKNITIDKKTFADVAQFDETLANEINGGKGPDLVIFPQTTSLDVMQMARNGAFASLNSYIENSKKPILPENYISSVFDAGKIGEEQYIMPLSIMIPFIQYNTIHSFSFEQEPVIPFETFMAAVVSDMEEFKNDEDIASLVLAYSSITQMPLSVSLLQTSQILQFSEDGKSLDYDEEQLRELVDFTMAIESEIQTKGKKIAMKSGNTLTASAKHFRYFFYFPKEFVYTARNANSINEAANQSETGISAFTGVGSDSVSAAVGTYGAVNKNAGDKAGYAYEFLREAIDAKLPNTHSQTPIFADLSINKYQIYEEIIACQSGSAKSITDGNQQIAVVGFSEKQAENLKSIVDGIHHAEIINNKLLSIVTESFGPYLDGTRAYESCLSDFEQRVNLYLTE